MGKLDPSELLPPPKPCLFDERPELEEEYTRIHFEIGRRERCGKTVEERDITDLLRQKKRIVIELIKDQFEDALNHMLQDYDPDDEEAQNVWFFKKLLENPEEELDYITLKYLYQCATFLDDLVFTSYRDHYRLPQFVYYPPTH